MITDIVLYRDGGSADFKWKECKTNSTISIEEINKTVHKKTNKWIKTKTK